MLIISLFFRRSPAALDNHRYYAALNGYRHVYVEAADIYESPSAQWLFRYETLLSEACRAQDDEIVLLLSENAAIVEPINLEAALGESDWRLTRLENSEYPQSDVQIWRNTARVRSMLLNVVHRCRFGTELPAVETELLREFDWVHWTETSRDEAGEFHAVLPASGAHYPVWQSRRVFALSIAEGHNELSRKTAHPRLREALLSHLNATREDPQARSLVPFHGAPPPRTQALEVFNPGRRIAICTLYTPNVAQYGCIAEERMRAYCDRHGYTLYVHRDVPAHLGARLPIRGNWVKPYLLLDNLPHHQWVFWLDADILVNDVSTPLEPLCDGRDIVLARDIGNWFFNSGVMGFRRTHTNSTLLASIVEGIENIEDKENVVTAPGDQYHFNRAVLEHSGMTNDDVYSFVEINTPWGFRMPSSFLVHYHGMSEGMRVLLMRYDIALRERELAEAA
jgi:hypothetical protein